LTPAEARPVVAALGEHAPAELRDPAADFERSWSEWMKQRDASIRSRLARGDEDSVVNLMLYGTSFTRQPRATPEAIATSGTDAKLADVMDGRLQDLVEAVESLQGDERVAFARHVIERQGLAVGPGSRESIRAHLLKLRSRVLADNDQYARRATTAGNEADRRSASATLYRDRGLSTDSSLRVDFVLERALAAVQERRVLGGQVERVAVVGPGLDFVDKAQGHDFYPVQMIQPFALADSLQRLGLAIRPSVTAFDISARVLDHLRGARQRARQGQSYRCNLVLERNRPGLEIDSEFVEYWRRAGDRLGTSVPVVVPPQVHDVQARAVDVRPEAVLAVEGVDLNIVFERLATPDDGRRFDLVVATNVLVYYEPFEQALAVTNMAGMLRTGGLLLTNQPVPVPPAWGLSPVLIMSVVLDRVRSATGSHERGDAVYVYRKE
jgi:SAM-dependent methyltransferase